MTAYFYNFKLGDPTRTYNSVSVAGTFNNWSTTHDKLKYEIESGHWTVGVTLEKPKFTYKYVVNGNDWILDKSAPSEEDSQGNENNYGIAQSIVLGAANTSDEKNCNGESAERQTTPAKPAGKDSDILNRDTPESNDDTPDSSLESAVDGRNDNESSDANEEINHKSLKADQNKNMSVFYQMLASIRWFINYYILSLFRH